MTENDPNKKPKTDKTSTTANSLKENPQKEADDNGLSQVLSNLNRTGSADVAEWLTNFSSGKTGTCWRMLQDGKIILFDKAKADKIQVALNNFQTANEAIRTERDMLLQAIANLTSLLGPVVTSFFSTKDLDDLEAKEQVSQIKKEGGWKLKGLLSILENTEMVMPPTDETGKKFVKPTGEYMTKDEVKAHRNRVVAAIGSPVLYLMKNYQVIGERAAQMKEENTLDMVALAKMLDKYNCLPKEMSELLNNDNDGK